MSEPNEHERIVEILKRASRPADEVTPESLEENLRWLLHATAPEAKASEALRQRVQALASGSAAPSPAVAAPRVEENAAGATPPPPGLRTRWWPRFGLPTATLGWRRLLLGMVPLTAASILLFLLLTVPAPAGVLEHTLSAMAKVRSAHGTGWFVEHAGTDQDGQGLADRMEIKWWYQAPDRYRKEIGPKIRGWSSPAGTLIAQGGSGLFVYKDGSSRLNLPLTPRMLAPWLSSLDFFSGTGLLGRARQEKGARIAIGESVYQSRRVKQVTVEWVERAVEESIRQEWVLFVDPASDRIVRSEVRRDRRGDDGSWVKLDEEVLDRFEYEVEVPARLFEVEAGPTAGSGSLRAPGRPAGRGGAVPARPAVPRPAVNDGPVPGKAG